MKTIVRCAACATAARRPGFGFAGADELYCSERGGAVEPDDGCTFGARGRPMTAVVRQDVDIGAHAAAGGGDP